LEPLEGGLLGGALQKAEGGRRASEGMQKRINELRPQLEKWESFCKQMGEKPADVALAWVLKNPPSPRRSSPAHDGSTHRLTSRTGDQARRKPR